MTGKVKAALAHQNILQYLAVVTDSRRVKKPLSLREALANIDIYAASLTVIFPKITTIATLREISIEAVSHEQILVNIAREG